MILATGCAPRTAANLPCSSTSTNWDLCLTYKWVSQHCVTSYLPRAALHIGRGGSSLPARRNPARSNAGSSWTRSCNSRTTDVYNCIQCLCKHVGLNDKGTAFTGRVHHLQYDLQKFMHCMYLRASPLQINWFLQRQYDSHNLMSKLALAITPLCLLAHFWKTVGQSCNGDTVQGGLVEARRVCKQASCHLCNCRCKEVAVNILSYRQQSKLSIAASKCAHACAQIFSPRLSDIRVFQRDGIPEPLLHLSCKQVVTKLTKAPISQTPPRKEQQLTALDVSKPVQSCWPPPRQKQQTDTTRCLQTWAIHEM